ncbi:hypothetical protein E6B08_08155 [Pseudomonas putida]|uniref:Imidazoleglycerol-phosphate synthase n=1 Tax=Pseudomonas putida TaxID=303 RepID=A0A4D6XA53_PSEPU|nr:hypothetical protein [Pseudomonas putida]QCI11371.1 hypothetical protein E6B08_08155 [Pseudomonas putida]
MHSHSKHVILERMKEASVRFGWGGVLALDRRLLDLVLREQFLEAIGNFRALEPISLDAELDEGGVSNVSFQGLVLGAPQVSFENTTVSSSELTVRLNIIAGEYLRTQRVPGRPKRVMESFTISEAMGYRVEAQLPLRVEQLETSRYASVVLDLASAAEFTTNLGPTDYVNIMIGRKLQESIGYMQAYRRTYALAHMRMDDYYPLSPKQLLVRTMAAPWGQQEHDPRHGDGAVLVFMQLGTDLRAGGQPDPSFDFPYPIPEEANGLPGTLILDPDIPDLGAGDAKDVLRTLQLSNDYAFTANDTQTPHDLVLFGSWRASAQSVVVEPGIISVVAGRSTTFAAEGATGAVQWSARNLRRPGVTGAFENGTYSPRGVADFAQDQQMVLVTATFPEAGGEGRRHALVMETARAMQVAPRVASWVEGNAPIELRAADSDGGTLEWRLTGAVRLSAGKQRGLPLDEALGKLEDLGNGRARFTPDPPAGGGPDLRVQRIRVSNRQSGEHAECAVVVIKWEASLNLVPFHLRQAESVQPTQFVVETERAVTWSVYGEGGIDANGVYTAPEAPEMPISVVAAEDDDRAGYAVVEFSEGRRVSAAMVPWTALSTFTIRAISAPRCFANGWQQIEVEVAVAAAGGPPGKSCRFPTMTSLP